MRIFVPHLGHAPSFPDALSGTLTLAVQYGQENWMAMENVQLHETDTGGPFSPHHSDE